MKFRKKPVIIEAMEIPDDHEGIQKVIDWINQCVGYAPEKGGRPPCISYYGDFMIHTLEGNMHASKGDWIIRGVKGEFYPCKSDIFKETYEYVE